MNIQLLNDLTVEDIQNGTFPLEKVVDESLYYPASGNDGSPIRHWGLGVNSFIYVDWLMDKDSLLGEIQQDNAFTGYRLLAHRDLDLHVDKQPSQRWAPKCLNREEYNEWHKYFINEEDNIQKFSIWAVFERLPGFSKQHGPDRFSFIYIRGEACITYHRIYVIKDLLPKIICLIRPGMNFRNFEQVFMETLRTHQRGLPPKLLCWHGRNVRPCVEFETFRPEYSVFENGGLGKDGEHDFRLSLFSRP
jgi:hypothetical protein